jgi:3-phenylpropionate/trans-cinnamate dioxygenase ferredoxin reductase component
VNTPTSVVVVGASLAGTSTAHELRRLGYQGDLHLVASEPGCNRPPLSKVGLRVGATPDDLALPGGQPDVQEHRVDAVGLDPAGQQVLLADGRTLGYDAVVVATGARARSLAGVGQSGELLLRTARDAERLRARLDGSRTAVVVGAGFLGVEVASACVARGLRVTLVDLEPPLLRLLGPWLAARAHERLRRAGVDVRISPAELVGDPVQAVRLADGSVLHADVVVTCAGDRPETGWLAGTCLNDPRGVLVDERGQTALPSVYAAGDVTRTATAGGTHRRPFWSNAVAQGKATAHGVLHLPAPDRATDDYFWTELLGEPVKVVGELPLVGDPEVLEEQAAGDVLRWPDGDGWSVVAWGLKRPVPRLRALAAG